MRRSSLLSRIAAIVAILIFPLAIVSAWLEATVTETDRYVATVAPLAEDPVVLAAVEKELTRAALELIDLDRREQEIQRLVNQRRVSASLQALLDANRGAIREAITSAVAEASAIVVNSPQFPDAWADANRSAHRELTAVLSGEQSQLVDADGRVSIQLDTLVTTAVALLDEQGIVDASQVPEVQASFTFMQAEDLDRAQEIYQLLDNLGFWLPLLWLILAVVAVVFARDRLRAVRWLAVGAILGVVLVAAALGLARDQVVAAGVVEDPAVLNAVWGAVTIRLVDALWLIGIGAGITWLVTLVISRVRSSR